MSTRGTVTILGINGHIGHHAAQAFLAAGWDVTGFGRANRHPLPGLRFVAGDASKLNDLRAAIGDCQVVVNALNLPYHQWDQGRMEALMARVIEAMGGRGRTLLFPGNIYNYAASDRVITPAMPQHPETSRGAIRVRVEQALQAAAARGDSQVLVVRAGDFYGPQSRGDWFDQVILREAGKGKLAVLGAPGVGHAWAYLPDLGRAFEKLAWHRAELADFEVFHFAGNFVTPEQMADAVASAAPVPLRQKRFPWALLTALGLINPVLRAVASMGYLWQHPMELTDPRLDAILGPDFSTPFAAAVASAVAPHFAARTA